jgi:hypothetical protein
MRYKLQIGFERYDQTFEIGADIYEEFASRNFNIGYNDTLKVETTDGYIFIKRIELKFLRVYKESE